MILSPGHSVVIWLLILAAGTSAGTVLSQQPLRLHVEVLSSRSVRVSWDEIESGDHDAKSFTIEYRKAGESDWQKITGILLTYATVDGLMPNKEYEFRVFGVNGAGSLSHGTVLSQQPLRLRVEVLSSSSVRVSWDEIESGDHDAETFTIEYRKAGESGWQEITGILLTYATVDGLIPNKEYDFRVFGVNGAGSGPKTDIMTTTTSEDAPSGPPTNVVVEATSAWQLKVKWDLPDEDKRNGNITQYQVKYEESRDEWLKNTTGSEREILLEKSDDIKPYTVYSVSVSAFTAEEQGPFSDPKGVRTLQAAPDGPPESVTAEPEGTGIRVTWSAPSKPLNGELVGYNITYMPSTDPGFKEVDQNVLSTAITDLVAYTEYSVRVQALTDRINRYAGPFSKAVTVRTNEQPPSGPPRHFQAHNVTHSSISVSWMAPLVDEHNGVLTFYKLQYYPRNHHSEKKVVLVDIGTRSQTISGLEPYTIYTVSVMAKNSAGSGPPAERHIRTRETAPSGPPTNVTVTTPTDWELNVVWELPEKDQRSGHIIQYQVRYKANGVEKLKNTTGSKLEILLREVDSIKPHTNYTVSVSAWTTAGQGPFSASVTVTTPQHDIRIEFGDTDVDGHNISVYQGFGLAKSIDCSIKPDNAGFTVPLTWKHDGDGNVHTLSRGQHFDIFQVNENGTQRLYINNTAEEDDGIYSCHASIGHTSLVPKSFTLHFNVDCIWSTWPACCGTCGIGTQKRLQFSPKQHDGRDCTGPFQQDCDTLQPPCTPTVGDFPVSVVEGMPVILNCHASQFAGLNDPISFGWFRVEGKSYVDVIIDGRVANSTHGHSGGMFTGKLMFTPANRNDSGIYKCKAFNVHGSSSLSGAVVVDVKSALTNSDDCNCNFDSLTVIMAALVLIIVLLTVIAVLVAVIVYLKRRTGKLLIAQDVRDKAGGSTELMDTAHDDPVCISISSTADCSARTTPCEITARAENNSGVEGDNGLSTLTHEDDEHA